MKKLLKIVGGLLVALVLLVVVAVVAVPLLVDPQDVKDQLASRVKERTGRELQVPGEVKLSVFPWLGATLGQVTLGNAPGFREPVFASTEKVDVRVKLMPLLDRRVEMDTVTVHGLTLNLERNEQGASNWEDLAAGGAGAGAKGAGTAPDAGGGGPGLAGFAIGGVDLRDATVSYTDAAAGQAFTVRNLALKTGSVSPGEPVDVELGFDLASTEPPLEGRVSASTRVAADPQAQTATLTGLAVSADVKGPGLPGGEVSAKLGADVSVDGARGTLAVRDLTLALLDLAVSGSLDVTGLDKKSPAVSGALKLAEFSPRKLMEGLGLPAVETADGGVLSKASLDAQLAGGADVLALKPLTIKLDDTTLSGEAKVSGFAKPALRFALALDAIDLDRYLPPGSDAPPATPGAAAGKAGELPLETLRGLDVAGTFTAGKVKVAKLTVSEVNATLAAKDGMLKLSPVTAKLYDGTYAGNIALDARKDTPVVTLDEKLAGVQAGPLLKDFQGKDPMSGTANVTAKLRAVGTAPDAVKRSLNGTVDFQFLDGAVNGVNIAQMIRDARARLRGEPVASDDAPKRTDFAEITGTATITDGLVSNQDLSGKSPLLRLTGQGTASLPQETIDYRTTATLVATSKGQGGRELGDLAGVPIPVRVTGTFADPKFGLDTEALAKAIAGSKAKEVVEAQKAKVTEKVEEKLQESLGDSVGKALGGSKEGIGGKLKGILGN